VSGTDAKAQLCTALKEQMERRNTATDVRLREEGNKAIDACYRDCTTHVRLERRPPKPRPSALDPLRVIAQHGDRALEALLAGAPETEALDPWAPDETFQEDWPRIQGQLDTLGATELRLAGVNLDLAFAGPEPLFVRVGALLRPDATWLIEVKQIVRMNHPLNLETEKRSPYARAAADVGKQLTGEGCAEIHMASLDDLHAVLGEGRLATTARNHLAATREKLPELCRRLQAQTGPIAFESENLIITAHRPDGTLVGALSGELPIQAGRPPVFWLAPRVSPL